MKSIKELDYDMRIRNWSIHVDRNGNVNGFNKDDYYVGK